MSNCSHISLEQMQKAIDNLSENIEHFCDRGLLTLRMFQYMPPRLRTFFSHYLHKNGLNESTWYALMVIYASHEQQTTPSRMSAVLDLTRTSATRLSDELVMQGWVARENCAEDRRQVILSLTPAGKEIIHTMVPILSTARAQLFHNFSDDEIETLGELMRKLLENVDDVNAQLLGEEKK